MTRGKWAPLLSNAEVRRRTAELMERHAEKMEQERPGWLATCIGHARLWTRVAQARSILANPVIPNVDKVTSALAILDGAPVVLVGRRHGGGS